MSLGTVPSSSSSGANDSQSGTEAMDRSVYVYQISEKDRISVCYYLDQNNVWEDAAKKMGYPINDIIVSIDVFVFKCFSSCTQKCMQFQGKYTRHHVHI